MSALAACPGCVGGAERAVHGAEGETWLISLPAIHCASCIAGAEGILSSVPGLRAARVNLGRRRVAVTMWPGLGAEPAIAALRAAGFEAHELDEAALSEADPVGRALLSRIAVSGFAMMNVMVLSVAVWSGAAETSRSLFHWISAAIALPAVAFAAAPFFESAWRALMARRLNMEVPIALAILLACATSLAETVTGGRTAWFDAALSLTFFLLVGRYLDHRARAAARSAAADLAALEIQRATLIEGQARRSVAVADLRPGDRIALAPGMRAPVDGRAESPARLDRSALTGESVPVEVAEGGAVCAGEVVLGAPLILTVTARAEDSTLRRLADLIQIAEGGRHRYSPLADRAARFYAPLVHLLAAAAFLAWWLGSGDAWRALGVATAVLIITCPCALGLAVPAVTTASAGRLFRRGVLVKSATALERLATVDTVLLDKTGTLTTGVARIEGLSDEEAAVARALARASAHPAARAVAAALGQGAEAALSDLRETPGTGVTGRMPDGTEAMLGRGSSGTVLRMGSAERPLEIEERLRPGAEAMVDALRDRGFDIRVLTGDAPERAERLAERLGGLSVHAALSPEDKAAFVARMCAEGRHVLVVGDGINDTAALAGADASVAPAAALDAARAASDVVLLSGDLGALPALLAEARASVRRIVENFAAAALYNVVAVPLALAGIATPLMAAIAMSLSSVTVVLNALRRPA